MKTRAIVLGLALGAAGCTLNVAPKPNGNQGVLFFGLELPNGTVRGMSEDVLIPESRHYHAAFETDYQVDFSQTTLTAQGDGLTVLETARTDEGYRVRVQCDSGAAATLQVKVMAGARPRYQDAYPVPCVTAAGLTVDTSALTSRRTIVGVTFPITARLTTTTAAGQVVEVGGHGWTINPQNGPVGLANDDASGQLQLVTLAAGTSASLVAGEVSAALPLEVVADSDWFFGISADTSALASSNNLTLTAGAIDRTGALITSLSGCSIAVEVGTGPGTDAGPGTDGGVYDAPDCTASLVVDRSARWVHACAAAPQRFACQDIAL